MSKNYRLPDYGDYHLQGKEGILCVLEGAVIVITIGYFFYHSWIACLCLVPVFFLFLKDRKKELARKRRQALGMQFKEMILSVAAHSHDENHVSSASGS